MKLFIILKVSIHPSIEQNFTSFKLVKSCDSLTDVRCTILLCNSYVLCIQYRINVAVQNSTELFPRFHAKTNKMSVCRLKPTERIKSSHHSRSPSPASSALADSLQDPLSQPNSRPVSGSEKRKLLRPPSAAPVSFILLRFSQYLSFMHCQKYFVIVYVYILIYMSLS